jgi:hypothetical protein
LLPVKAFRSSIFSQTLNKTSNVPDTVAPIMTFAESDDHVYDVKWSPSHPAVFASVDGSGRFDIYNLNQDLEVRNRNDVFESRILKAQISFARYPS